MPCSGGLANFRPDRLQKLLKQCASVRVKRLSLLYAIATSTLRSKAQKKEARRSWALVNAYSVKGGVLNSTYQITVPGDRRWRSLTLTKAGRVAAAHSPICPRREVLRPERGAPRSIFSSATCPCLSVVLDLTYVPVAPRAKSLADIDAALKRIVAKINEKIPGAQVHETRKEHDRQTRGSLAERPDQD